MNYVALMGRLCRDPETRYSANDNHTAISRYTLAVDRANNEADFVQCVALGTQGEFAEKYLKKGMKIVVEGKIRTGSYTREDGTTVYTTDVVVNRHEFCERKSDRSAADDALVESYGSGRNQAAAGHDEFVTVPEGIDEELPFM